jgi:hypothetical protein
MAVTEATVAVKLWQIIWGLLGNGCGGAVGCTPCVRLRVWRGCGSCYSKKSSGSRPHLADTRDDSFSGDGDEGSLALLLILLVDSCVFQRALVRVLKLVPVLGIEGLLHKKQSAQNTTIGASAAASGPATMWGCHTIYCALALCSSASARECKCKTGATMQLVFISCDPTQAIPVPMQYRPRGGGAFITCCCAWNFSELTELASSSKSCSIAMFDPLSLQG